MRIDVVSASAGSGKTHRLVEILSTALLEESVRPEGVVAVTYTVKAAGELESRIRTKLLEKGKAGLAGRVRDGYLGTIHAICQRLLREFALEAGLSPRLEPVPEPERRRLFGISLASVLLGREGELDALARRLSIEDWKETLLSVVDAARANGMDAAALRRSAAESREGLARLLPHATASGPDYLVRLRAAHALLQPKLAELAAGTVKEDKRREALGRWLTGPLSRNELPAWKAQVDLAGSVDVKKLANWATPLRETVDAHLYCEAFQEDLFRYSGAIFDLAAEALDAFVAEKEAEGVVDYGDMLARAHGLLALPAVREALGARLDLVLVDEFQDTSPLQLAVLSALGGVARKSVWVGDRKQAIFGFQGSDPELMSAAAATALGGRAPEILGKSWRSRPPLVELVSDLFAKALAPHGFPEEQVRLTAEPDPPELSGRRVVECWRWAPGSTVRNGAKVSSAEAHALAAGVAELLADPPLVREKQPDGAFRVRPAGARDVAILARSNDRCRDIAKALRDRGIPARVALSGVTFTPEGVLARATLALLADPADGVAALEVAWLGGAGERDPDGWLSARLVEVARWRKEREDAGARGERGPPEPLAFADDPKVAALRDAAPEAARLSPAEALDLALRVARIASRVRAWPDPGQRLANLEALRAEARAYEALCAARRSAATTLGLVAHLGAIAEDDGEEGKQAVPSAEDAVTVSTWHRAKGLEWPIVVLSHLDHARERFVFDPAVEPAPAFDFERPLDGRTVRLWTWPYAKLRKELALLVEAGRSAEGRRARETDRRERLRLLYVGFTRARDLLVLAACVKEGAGAKAPALDLLSGEDGTALLRAPFAEDPGERELVAAGRGWPCLVRDLSGFPPAVAGAQREPARDFAPGVRATRPPERLSPSDEPLAVAARVARVTRLEGRVPIDVAEGKHGPLGDAIHAFLAADLPGDDGARAAMAARLLSAHGVTGAIAPAALLAASASLRAFLEARFPGATWRREWPVRARLAEDPPRLLVGEVDLFLELADGFVVVDHKSFKGTAAERDRKVAEEYAPQLGWYARVLRDALGKPLAAAFVHFPIRGEMAEVELG